MRQLLTLVTGILAVTTVTTLAGHWGEDIDYLFTSKGNDTAFEKLVEDSTWDGELGLQFRSENPDTGEEGSAGWGYFQFGWESGYLDLMRSGEDKSGLQLGVGGVAVLEAWEKHAFEGVFSDSGDFADEAKWTSLYMKYSVPGTKTHFIVGRAQDDMFGEPASGDGDYYQGFGITIADIPRIEIKASVVNEWLDNASASWDLDGIQDEWQSMDDVVRDETGVDKDAGRFAYTLMTEIEAVRDFVTVTPYVQHHSDVATSYGLSFNAERPVNESLTLGLDGAYSKHMEDTSNAAGPNDGDVSQTMLHAYGKVRNFNLGFGYYTISDDAPLFNNSSNGDDFEAVFVMDEFDPMEEDLAKYGEQQGNDTLFVDAGYEHGPVSLDVVYGWTDNAIIEGGAVNKGNARELDVVLGVDLIRNLKGELAYVTLQDGYTADGDRSMDMFAGALSYNF